MHEYINVKNIGKQKGFYCETLQWLKSISKKFKALKHLQFTLEPIALLQAF